jgi:hypothetical protein
MNNRVINNIVMNNRVLSRRGARVLSPEEADHICGAATGHVFCSIGPKGPDLDPNS